jgi:hypothetical protein
LVKNQEPKSSMLHHSANSTLLPMAMPSKAAVANASALTACIVSIASVALLSSSKAPCPARPAGRAARNEEEQREQQQRQQSGNSDHSDNKRYAGLGLAARLAEAVQTARKG